MTDKTDITGLKDHNIRDFVNELRDGAFKYTGAQCMRDVISRIVHKHVGTLVLSLKTERQRAETLQTERDEFRRRLKLERSILEDADKQIAELKAKLANPNVLPVGEIVAWSGTDREKGITREVDFRFLRFDVQPGQQLFTAPHKPVVVMTDELDFDCELEKADGFDVDEEPWLRGRVDGFNEAINAARKAIEAAGCIVKGGKLLALRQGDNMKEKCLTCGREMSNEPDSLNLNCGGDCLECMASHGDPDCISAVARIKARKRDAGSSGTEA